MAVNWDWLITGGILITLALSIWAKVSNQTIIELLREIREFIAEMKGEATEEVTIYE